MLQLKESQIVRQYVANRKGDALSSLDSLWFRNCKNVMYVETMNRTGISEFM